MKKLMQIVELLAVVAAVHLAVGPAPILAETIKKQHPAITLVATSGTTGVGVNDVTDATAGTGTSNTIDLSGGDYRTLSFGVFFSSGICNGACTGQGTLAVEVSPNGGSNWLSSGYSVLLTTGGATGQATSYFNIPVGIANKARITLTLSSNTTWYNYRLWALPSVD